MVELPAASYFVYDNMNRMKAKYYGQAHYDQNTPDVKYYYDNDLGDANAAHSWGKLRRQCQNSTLAISLITP